MKGTLFNKIFLLAFFLLISINKTTQSESVEFNTIADASFNATASFASFEKQNYVYFLYDMNPFLKDDNRASVIFKLTSSKKFFNYEINYLFLSKKIDAVNPTEIIENKIKMIFIWKFTNDFISQKTINNEYDHYISINSSLLNKVGLNTLVIRVKVFYSKGDLTIENLLSLPEDIKKELDNKKNNEIPIEYVRDIINQNKYKNNNHNKDYNNGNYNKDYNNGNYNKDYYNGNYNKDYYNGNYNKDYYSNNNYQHTHGRYYGNGQYNYHLQVHNERFYFHSTGFTVAGIIFSQIWVIIFLLYCIVNRRKVNNNRFAVIVGNIQQ